MQLDSLVLDHEDAKERLAEYEKALGKERSAEDEAIAAGYRAAARGLPVISLKRAMNAGGWFEDGLPRLAVCRADAIRCWVTVAYRFEQVTFSDAQRNSNMGAWVGKHTVRVAMDEPTTVVNQRRWASTIVPLVPPAKRPKRGRLGLFHVLWEVERWDNTPPLDPALLRHIRGDLWAVMAVWDLTELERAVLSQRA